MPTEAFVRHQPFGPAAAAAGVAVVFLIVCGPAAAPVTAATAPGAATGQGCITYITFGPQTAGAGGFRALNRVSGAHALADAGSPAPAVPRRPAGTAPTAARSAGTTYTVTVTGTGITGQPANHSDGRVFLFNADDSARFGSVQVFTHGAAKFQVPPGHYWALGDFVKPLPKQQSWDEYLDVLPQFPVTGNTTIHLAAAAATSPIRATVARPAISQYLTFQLIRSAAAGPPVSLGWMLTDNGPTAPTPTVYLSPTSARPTVGKLATVTSQQLGPAAFASGSPYLYDLAYQSRGTIPPQEHVVNQAALATVRLRYFSSVPSDGLSNTFPTFPVNQVCQLGGAIFGGMRFPVAQTMYALASPPLAWQTQFIQNQAKDYSGGQIGPFQAFVRGQHQTQNFGAYPLHPAPNVRVGYVGGPPVQVSAGRAGNTLRLAMTAFSDSVPGHVGQGTFPPVRTAGSYQIDQNGTKIAGGTLPNFFGAFAATTTLSPAASTIRLSLNAAQSAKLDPLSTASHTVWTWRSAPSSARLPAGWTCLPGGAADRACAVQPLMTLRYGVVGLGLNGAAAPGQQVVRVLVGHLPLARAAKITAATVSVSFDGGKTWRAARMTGAGNSYAAVFSAPAGTRVTLRTSASDAAGGSITETITNAYQVAS